jgi:hypothetical protein
MSQLSSHGGDHDVMNSRATYRHSKRKSRYTTVAADSPLIPGVNAPSNLGVYPLRLRPVIDLTTSTFDSMAELRRAARQNRRIQESAELDAERQILINRFRPLFDDLRAHIVKECPEWYNIMSASFFAQFALAHHEEGHCLYNNGRHSSVVEDAAEVQRQATQAFVDRLTGRYKEDKEDPRPHMELVQPSSSLPSQPKQRPPLPPRPPKPLPVHTNAPHANNDSLPVHHNDLPNDAVPMNVVEEASAPEGAAPEVDASDTDSAASSVSKRKRLAASQEEETRSIASLTERMDRFPTSKTNTAIIPIATYRSTN